jgi:hypothetical protein
MASLTATEPSPGRKRRYSKQIATQDAVAAAQTLDETKHSPRSVVSSSRSKCKTPEIARRMMSKGAKERLMKESQNRKDNVATSVLSLCIDD